MFIRAFSDQEVARTRRSPSPSFGGFGFVKINYSKLTVAQIEWVSIGGYPYAKRQPIRRAQIEDDVRFGSQAEVHDSTTRAAASRGKAAVSQLKN